MMRPICHCCSFLLKCLFTLSLLQLSSLALKVCSTLVPLYDFLQVPSILLFLMRITCPWTVSKVSDGLQIQGRKMKKALKVLNVFTDFLLIGIKGQSVQKQTNKKKPCFESCCLKIQLQNTLHCYQVYWSNTQFSHSTVQCSLFLLLLQENCKIILVINYVAVRCGTMLCLECLATICPAFGASQIFMSKTKNETPCHIFFFFTCLGLEYFKSCI